MKRRDIKVAQMIHTVGSLRAALAGLPDEAKIEFVHPSTGLGLPAIFLVPKNQRRALLASAYSPDCRDLVPEV